MFWEHYQKAALSKVCFGLSLRPSNQEHVKIDGFVLGFVGIVLFWKPGFELKLLIMYLLSIMWPVLKKAYREFYDTVRFMSVSEKRQAYYVLTGLAATTTTGAYLSLHTRFVKKTVEHLQMYRMRVPIPLSSDMKILLEQTIEDLSIPVSSNVSLYNFIGPDFYSLGHLKLASGGYIGVPFNFHFKSTRNINPNDLRLLFRYKTKRSMSNPVMQNLINSLVVSDRAKKYCFAHQLYQLNSFYLPAKGLNVMAFTSASLLAIPRLNRHLDMKGPLNKSLTAIVVMSFAITLGTLVDHMLDQVWDYRSLKRTLQAASQTEHSQEYTLGAIEYYSKLVQRNKALYDLLNDYGPKFFTEDGNARQWLFGLLTYNCENRLLLAQSFLKAS